MEQHRLVNLPLVALVVVLLLGAPARGIWAQKTTAPSALEASLNPGYKVVVRETGIYKMTGTYLAAAGLPVGTLDATKLQMFHHDQEIAITVVDDGGDGFFDTDDYLLFYGEAVSGKYAKYTWDNVYWLTYGQEAGLRMVGVGETPGSGEAPATFEGLAHFEEDLYYWSFMPGDDDDFARWRWARAYAPTDITRTLDLNDVAQAEPGEDPLVATIRVSMFGFPPDQNGVDPQQHVAVYVNTQWVGEYDWSGIEPNPETVFAFDQLYLNEGTDSNTILLENLGADHTAVALDWIEIGYQRSYRAVGDVLAFGGDVTGVIEIDGFTAAPPVGQEDLIIFDVTDPLAVKPVLNSVWDLSVLEPGKYRVRFVDTAPGEQSYWVGLPRPTPVSIELDSPSNLRSTAIGYDYIMITHRKFYDTVMPLRTYYHEQVGIPTVLVDVQDVYDEFSGGVFYPGAIRDFLSYAYHNSGGDPPDYVLLVGDGHYDFKELDIYTNLGQYVPPYLAHVDAVLGETAADNRYVCVDGDDRIPDMALGRFPVNTVAEAEAMVNKSLDYQQDPPTGGWNSSMLFVADNPDGGGNFYQYSDDVIEDWVPASYTATQIYYGTEGYTDAGVTRQAVNDAISAGQVFVSYIGHAAVSWWADEKIFHTADVGGLTNGGMLPIMLPMTCLEGRYMLPSSYFTPSVSEAMVRVASGGAVASFAPTGWGAAAGHDVLQRGFFNAVFAQGETRLGDVTKAAKEYLAATSGGKWLDLLDTYVLLGDPALTINLSEYTGVTIGTFTAEAVSAGSVVLRWETVTETGTLGFNLYRAQSGEAERLQINPTLIPSDAPLGVYEFVDDGVEAGATYDYWLEEVDIHGSGALYGPVQVIVPAIFQPEYRLLLPLVQQQH